MFQMFIMILIEERQKNKMRKTELLEIGCLEATKKDVKVSKKEEKNPRKQRLQKKMKMRKFE